MNTTNLVDPFDVLGVPYDASESEIRARYLQLVKEFPPERDPEKFQQVQKAFEAVKDPLIVAARLVAPPSEDVPAWSDAINAYKQRPPALTLDTLLSLGNRESEYSKQHRVDPPHE